MTAPELIRAARTRAGITQGELARRLGTTQSAVARLEAAGSSPRLVTLERAVGACGSRVELSLAPAPSSIDETLVAEMLRLSPAERLASFQRSYAGVRKLALAGRRG
jgi:transcriptional regulator with XRE-family HTH domain